MTQAVIAPYVSLSDALAPLAARIHVSSSELHAYADADLYGGRDTGDFSAMCLHRDEGRLLYALVRVLKPQRVLEIGVADGGSATHILAALAANGQGVLTSYDILPGVGASIPAELRSLWTLHVEDALTADLPQADFIFEDAAHTLDFSLTLYAHLKALAPRALVVHDYTTGEVYPNFYVRQAFDTVFPDGFGLKLKDAFTGLGVWVNDEWQAPVMMPVKPPALTPKPKAKRTGKRTAKR